MDDLEERVNQFNLLRLPGQPIGMHMGTSYLVNDLWRELKRLRAVNDLRLRAAQQGVPADPVPCSDEDCKVDKRPCTDRKCWDYKPGR